MNKSISELAKELNVSRQAVYQRIRNDKELSTSLSQFTVKQGNTKVYTLQGQELIKQAFDRGVNVNSKPSIDSKSQSIDSKLIDTLTQQLEQKDKQLEEKQQTINRLLDQIDKLTTSLQAEQAMHGIDKQQKVIEISEAAAPAPDPTRQKERRSRSEQRSPAPAPVRSGTQKEQRTKMTFADRLRKIFR